MRPPHPRKPSAARAFDIRETVWLRRYQTSITIMLVRTCRKHEKRQDRRATRARQPAEGARAPRAPAAVRQHVQPRLPDDWDRLETGAKATAWLQRQGAVAARRSPTPTRRAARVPRGAARADRRPRTGCCAEPRTCAARTVDARAAPRSNPRSDGVDGVMATLLGDRARGAAQRRLVTDEGVPAMRVRVLRPLEESLGHVVRDVDLRQPDEEPRVLPAPAGADEASALLCSAAAARSRRCCLRADERSCCTTWSWRRRT